MTTYHGKFGTKQIPYYYDETEDGATIDWYDHWQTTLPTLPDMSPETLPRRPVKTILHRDPEAIPDIPAEPPTGSKVTWQGEHPLTEEVVRLVERIDYATVDEDMAQDMLCSLLARAHSVRNQTDFRRAVRYAILDARRRAAQMTPAGISWESLPDDCGGSVDHRREQLPGPIKPYDGPTPTVVMPQSTVAERVIAAETVVAGLYRFDRECQVAAYVMPD
jgi:hypothetical protein